MDKPEPPRQLTHPEVEALKARPPAGRSMVELWVIQKDTPESGPGRFTVRRHFLFHGTADKPKSSAQETRHTVCDSLEEARRWVPDGLFRMPQAADNVVTVEIWL